MLILGDCLEKMKEMEDNSVDSIVTDPPYGWRFMGNAWDAPDIEKRIVPPSKTEWHENRKIGHKRSGLDTGSQHAGSYDLSPTANQAFQSWTNLWAQEALRVLKPGGHALIFCGPRTYHRMCAGVEDAGFEIRDQLQWIFGSGFPKSHNLKDEWQGWGTALKPANEPICLARKPLSEKTVASNVQKWGTGAINIDASRVPLEGGKKKSGGCKGSNDSLFNLTENPQADNSQGRWPANLILGCCGEEPHEPGCAVAMLDEQSVANGIHSAGKGRPKQKHLGDFGIGDHGNRERLADHRFEDSSIGASRFFYVAKASKSERNAGLEGMPEKDTHRYGAGIGEGLTPEAPSRDKNHHPTVKPIKLMAYLCRLITPPKGIVLDPFMGSGSTGLAAKQEGFDFIGIEMNEEYVEIAKRRINGVA